MTSEQPISYPEAFLLALQAAGVIIEPEAAERFRAEWARIERHNRRALSGRKRPPLWKRGGRGPGTRAT